jgi:hypothetical protein
MTGLRVEAGNRGKGTTRIESKSESTVETARELKSSKGLPDIH